MHLALILLGSQRIVDATDEQEWRRQCADPVPHTKLVNHYQIIMLGAWPNLMMAGDETLSEFGSHKPHRLPHGGDPLLVHCRLRGGSQPHIDTAWGPMFRAHGHGHEHQTTDFLRIVQAGLQGDTGPQRIPDQDQITMLALGPQPAPHPFGIALNTRTGHASPVPGQGRSKTAAKIVELVTKRLRTSSGTGAVKKH